MLTQDRAGAADSRCIHQIFEAQVGRSPDSIAISLGGSRLTYRELDDRANQLANHLVKLGVRPGVLVGICLDRRVELMVGLLAILKAGGAYVPMDPQYPAERRALMLEDSNSPIILSEAALAPESRAPRSRVVLLDEDWPAISREPASSPRVQVKPEDLAYVIYTSGSTGKPKGTLISHHNVARLFEATQPWFGFTERDVWTLFHSCAFDFSVWEMWGALFYGGRLVVVPFGLSRTPDAFLDLLHEEAVTVLNQTPSAFRQLMRAEEGAPSGADLALRYVIFGGEALDPRTLRPWFDRHGDARPRLVNMYGITETTVHVTYRPLTAADTQAGSLIGVPIPDLRVYLLDEERRPVPAGEPGEIYVGGEGVARGYLNRPELTAQRFVPDPFAAPGERMYRSGDLGRCLPGGDLEYLGRIDQQVKIRGFRVELGEISAALDDHPGVRESVVVLADAAQGEKELAAYLVRRDASELDFSALRQSLRRRLPEYMVPATFTIIERLPLTVNGKLDVRALPPPDRRTRPLAAARANDATPLERDIARIWRDVLEIPEPDPEQNFFDVGGNSIHVAEVHARLQALLGRRFPITELFAHSTVRSMAAHFSGALESGETSKAHRARAQRQRATVLAQRRIRRDGR